MGPGDDEDDTEIEGVTPPRPSQAKLDALEEVESDDDEAESNPDMPPVAVLFEAPLNVVDDDERQERLQESYAERAVLTC